MNAQRAEQKCQDHSGQLRFWLPIGHAARRRLLPRPSVGILWRAAVRAEGRAIRALPAIEAILVARAYRSTTLRADIRTILKHGAAILTKHML